MLPSIKQPDLLLARLYYFVFMGGWGFVFPFLNLFYASLGFSGTQIGVITSMGAIVSLVAAPFVVNEVKKSPFARPGLQLILFISGGAYYLLSQQTTFPWVLAVVFVLTIFNTSVMPLSDSFCMSIGKERNAGFGSIRALGSLGWIFVVPFTGWLVQNYGYKPGFVGVFAAYLCMMMIISLLEKRHFTIHQADEPGQKKAGILEISRRILSRRVLLGITIALFLSNFFNNGILQFENIFLSDLGASKQLISIASILQAVVEIPFMLIADRIMRRTGPQRMMMFAFLILTGQRIFVLAIPSITTIMIARLVGGISFSMLTVSFIGSITQYALPDESGAAMALLSVTVPGLVGMVASPIMGAFYDSLGGHWLYAFAVTGYMLATLTLWVTRPGQSAKSYQVQV